MTTEKPLHVRVAEALGCKPIQTPPRPAFAGYWSCSCSDHRHNEVDVEGGHHYWIVEYGNDWSATGPLIERYFIGLKYQERKWWAGRKGHPHSVWYSSDTPLLAVCNLILALSAAGKLTS